MRETLYLSSVEGLERENNNLIIFKNWQKHRVPINVIESIVIASEITITSKLLSLLNQLEISIHFLGYYWNYIGSFYGKEKNTNGYILLKQAEFFVRGETQITLIKKLLDASFYNIIQNLTRSQVKNQEGIEEIRRYRRLLRKSDLKPEEFLGLEGNVRKIYYSYWEEILKEKYEFKRRTKQPPDNIVNVLISFLNTLCYNLVNDRIMLSGLSPFISFYHSSFYKRYSLTLDISEIFKPLLVDRMIFSLLNYGTLNKKDFEIEKETWLVRLPEATTKLLFEKWNEKKKQTIFVKKLGKDYSWEWMISLELYKIQRFLIEGEDFEFYKIHT